MLFFIITNWRREKSEKKDKTRHTHKHWKIVKRMKKNIKVKAEAQAQNTRICYLIYCENGKSFSLLLLL